MRIPRQLLCSALTSSLTIALVVLPARAQTQTAKTAGEPSRSQPSVPPPRLPVPITTIGESSITKPNVPSQQQPGVAVSCDEQIKNQNADDPNGSRANYDLGWCYLSSKKFDDAVTAFQKAIQSIPKWINEREEKDSAHLPELQRFAGECSGSDAPQLSVEPDKIPLPRQRRLNLAVG
jgi:tetratricopeptide (TPR) repeat protein